MTKSFIRIVSINTRGLKNNLALINQYIEEYDVLVVQETWLEDPDTINEFLIKTYNINTFQIKASRKVEIGRPKGGLAFIAKNHLKCNFREISEYIGVLKMRGTAIVGVYLPYDCKDNEFEFKLQITKLEELILKLKKDYDVIIVGDFNSDLHKKGSYNSRSLKRLIKRTGFTIGEAEFSQSFNYTYFFKETTSHLDHVLINMKYPRVESVKIIKDPKNSSDHLALEIITEIRVDKNKTQERLTTKKIAPKWQLPIYRRRYNLLLTLYCNQVKRLTDDLNKATELNQVSPIANSLYTKLCALLSDASNKAMDIFMRNKGRMVIKSNPWYTKKVIELGDEKRLASERYEDVRSDENLYRKRTASNAYRNEIRLNKQRIANNEALNLESIHATNRDEFWRIIKRKLGRKTHVQVPISELEKEFREQFSVKITTSAPSSTEIENQIKDFTEKTRSLVFEECNVTLEQVKTIVATLKPGKSIGPSMVSNEMLLFCQNNIIFEAIQALLIVALKFGYIPQDANQSFIKPLVKDETKSMSDIGNIRPISVSDVFATILEKLLLIEVNKVHINIDKQFGFKEISSCSHATYCLTETVKAGRRKGLKTYPCAIDASKAFDKVNRFLLFKKILLKTSWALTRTIISYYNLSMASVVNDGDQSDFFSTSLGVKQGGCLSPRLFAIYVEELAELIEKSPYGIRVGGLKMDIILYADDVILLSNTALDLQAMLDLTSLFGLNHEIKFNVKKTNIIIFHNKCKYVKKNTDNSDDRIRFRLDGQLVPIVDKIRYLGTWIDKYLTNSYNISDKIRGLACKINSLEKLGFKTKSIKPSLKAFYYKTYVRPYFLYGLEVLTLGAGEYRRIKTAEGNVIKHAIGLPSCVWTTDLFLALELNTISKTLQKLKMGLMLRLLNNKITRNLTLAILKSSQRIDISDSMIAEVIKQTKPVKITLNEIRYSCAAHTLAITRTFKEVKSSHSAILELRSLLNGQQIDEVRNKLMPFQTNSEADVSQPSPRSEVMND